MKEVVKCTNWCEDRMLQSADEIERLAKHSANVEEQYSNYHEWATAEIERLTESLRQREDQLRISLDEQRASTPPAAELAAGIEWLKQEICDGEEYLQRYPNSVDELAQQEHRQRLLDAITGSAQPPVATRSELELAAIHYVNVAQDRNRSRYVGENGRHPNSGGPWAELVNAVDAASTSETKEESQ